MEFGKGNTYIYPYKDGNENQELVIRPHDNGRIEIGYRGAQDQSCFSSIVITQDEAVLILPLLKFFEENGVMPEYDEVSSILE